MPELVSVITTVFNAESFLDEAVQSVIAQPYNHWELIIVDDGSTDSSARAAQAWCDRDPRIRLLQHPEQRNRGISASRNLGLSAAHGEFVALLDADDVWLPNKLAIQIETLKTWPDVALTFGAAERWYSWNRAAPPAADFIVASALPGWGSDCVLPPPVLLEAFLKEESLTPCTCSVLMRRSVVTALHGFENAFTGLYDDQVFYAKLALAHPVYVSSECLARYRQHDRSSCATARRTGAQAQAKEAFLGWLQHYRQTCPVSP